VLELIQNKEHFTSEGLNQIISIRASINKGLSKAFTEAFPSISPIGRPKIEAPEIFDPNWIAGFTEGEGCFSVNVIKSKAHKIGCQIVLVFVLSQHKRDEKLLKSLVEYFGFGRYQERQQGGGAFWWFCCY